MIKKTLQEIFDILDKENVTQESRIDSFLKLLKQKDFQLEKISDINPAPLPLNHKREKAVNALKNMTKNYETSLVVEQLSHLCVTLLQIFSDMLTPKSIQEYRYLFEIERLENLEDLKGIEAGWRSILASETHVSLQKRVVSIVARLTHLSRIYDDKLSKRLVDILLNLSQSITDQEVLEQLEKICDIGEGVLRAGESLDSQDVHHILNDLQDTLQENSRQIDKLKEIKNQIVEQSNAIAQSNGEDGFIEIVNKFYDKVLFLNNSLQNKERGMQELSFQLARLMGILKDMEEKTRRDTLTDLYNHGHLNAMLLECEQNFSKDAKNYSVLFFDIDGFKTINDTCGHILGDEILKLFSNILLNNSRNSDIVGRYGGDEFLVIMPNTSLNDAKDVALRICAAVEKEGKDYKNKNISITTSIGVSDRASHISWEAMLANADTLLYKAKRSGRNQVQWQ